MASDPQEGLKLDVVHDPQLRLVIRDPKTQAVLWGFTEHVQWAILQGNRDKNFDQGIGKLMLDLKGVVARVTPANR